MIGLNNSVPDKSGRYPAYTDFKVTLTAAGWSGDTAPYTQSVTVSGINGRNITAFPNYPEDDYDVCTAMREACAMVTFAKQDDDVVTFTCLEDKPDVDIPTIIRAGA